MYTRRSAALAAADAATLAQEGTIERNNVKRVHNDCVGASWRLATAESPAVVFEEKNSNAKRILYHVPEVSTIYESQKYRSLRGHRAPSVYSPSPPSPSFKSSVII